MQSPLVIVVPGQELFDNEKQKFITTEDVTLRMEHSLVAIHNWESKWHKPFLTPNGRTGEEVFDYFRMMCLDDDVDPTVFDRITEENLREIQAYMENTMTATTFSNLPDRPGRQEIVTAEIVYYWMVSLQIPLDRETWHFGRLIALIKTVNGKNAPKKKMNTKDALAQQRELNAQRRAAMQSNG